MRTYTVLAILIFCNFLATANNLRFGLASIHENRITVSIAWDNSWNLTQTGGSSDAVWLFAKGKLANGVWEHVNFSSNLFDHLYNEPLTIEAAGDGKGVFICPANQGAFSVPFTNISIKVSSNLSSYVELKVYGIEMVYIPQGAFYLGDGASISSLANNQGNPFLVSSEEAISSGTLTLANPNNYFDPPALSGTIPVSYPKGYSPFYVMKYEVSQFQYVDFLNTLTYTQQQNRTWRSPNLSSGTFAMVNPYQTDSLYRNSIVIATSGVQGVSSAVYAVNGNANQNFNEESDAPYRAANFFSWADLAAYLDWAALRPITEMEFEKACRGTNSSVAGEFAWGTPYITNANTAIYDGTVFETVSEVSSGESGLANHGTIIASQGWGLRGPLRTGFAANQSSTRISAGASFYGVMEMSGNVWEMVIAANGDGLNFSRIFGDGILDSNGNANESGWSNSSTASGVILRGGAWGSIVSEVGAWRDLAVSDRYYSHVKPSTRRNSLGGRGGR
jgi:formylglycine-generating enzyme required for sulfatase activity